MNTGLVLGIDTCGAECAGAILDAGGRLLALRTEPMERGHAEALGPVVAEMIRGLGAVPGDLTAIGVTLGPGSFTGLRVGLGFARGIGLGLGVPVAGISSIVAPLVLGDALRARPFAALAPNPAWRPTSGPDAKAYVEVRRGIPGDEPELMESRVADLPGLIAGLPAGTEIIAPESWAGFWREIMSGTTPEIVDIAAEFSPDLRLLPTRPAAIGAALAAFDPNLPGARRAVPLYVRPPRASLPG